MFNFDKLVLAKIISFGGTKQDQMTLFSRLLRTCSQWYRTLHNVKNNFQQKCLSWYHYADKFPETYQGFRNDYKHGKYFKFSVQQFGNERYLLKEGEYNNNLIAGEWTKYNHDGLIMSKRQYAHGLPCGRHFWYNEDGKVIRTKEYDSNGQLTGVMIRNTGIHIVCAHYQNGKKHGLYTKTLVNYPRTNVVECNYVNGSVEGEYIERWPDKKIKTKAYYVGGLLHGEYLKFHNNAKHHVKCFYNNGHVNGKTKMWWANGYLAEVSEMNNGVPHGVMLQYSVTGVLKYSGTFENGVEVRVSFKLK